MTTRDKLAKVEAEFAREGYEVKATVVEFAIAYDYNVCDQCGRGRSICIRVKGTPPYPKQPMSKSAEALEKHDRERSKWFDSIFHLTVCADRHACRLRTAKREYKRARRGERARRKCERALRV